MALGVGLALLQALIAAGGCRSDEVRAEPPSTSPAPSPSPEPGPAKAPAAGPRRVPVPVPVPATPPPPGSPPTPVAPPAPAGPSAGPDYYFDRFGGYMSADLRARYLATPPDERFRRFGEQILDWERRDAALEPYRARLSARDLDRYRALPDVESAQRFLDAKFPKTPRPEKP